MKSSYNALDTKFSALMPREKSLILVCGLVAIVFLLHVIFIEPIQIKQQQQHSLARTLHSNNQQTQQMISQLTQALNQDPNQEIEKEYQQLNEKNQQLALQLEQQLAKVISPQRMTQLLYEVLEKNEDLHLVSLQTLAAKPLNNAQEGSAAQYYIHPVRLEISGAYFAIRDYLAALESLPIQYYWQSFSYEVEQYPKAKVNVQVYTLGTNKEFIGG